MHYRYDEELEREHAHLTSGLRYDCILNAKFAWRTHPSQAGLPPPPSFVDHAMVQYKRDHRQSNTDTAGSEIFRRCIVERLSNEEMRYCETLLTISAGFCAALNRDLLKRKSSLGAEKFRKFLISVKKLRKVHMRFSTRLQRVVHNWDDHNCLGHVLLDFLPLFREYGIVNTMASFLYLSSLLIPRFSSHRLSHILGDFMAYYGDALMWIGAGHVRDFICGCEDAIEDGSFPYLSYLDILKHRLCRYGQFIESFVQVTSRQHSDTGLLLQVRCYSAPPPLSHQIHVSHLRFLSFLNLLPSSYCVGTIRIREHGGSCIQTLSRRPRSPSP